MFRLCLTCLLVLTAVGELLAQAPTGTIAGTVTDQSGAVVPNAKITIVNKDTGSTREMLAGTDGTFSAAALPAGKAAALKVPSVPASISRVEPVSLLTMVILALGTTAPDWSVTVPAIVPVGAWASSAPTAVKTSRHVRQSRNMDPPKCNVLNHIYIPSGRPVKKNVTRQHFRRGLGPAAPPQLLP